MSQTLHPLPTIFQLRNNCIIKYKDISQLNIKRNGCKLSLKQYQGVTIYSENIDKMKDISFLDDINEYANTYEENYNLHSTEYLKPKGIIRKKLGTISLNQKRKFSRIVENCVNVIYINPKTKDYKKGNYSTFLTLTLPSKQLHTDKSITKCLTRFLENLKKTKKVLNYVWKSEPQKNGNIHFHVLLDKWVDKEYINNRWNIQINTLGYVDRSNSTNPPSTKIHSLGNVKNIVSYIQKYMIKEEKDKRPIIGKIFGYSRSAGKLEYPKMIFEGATINQQNQLMSLLNKGLFKKYDDIDYITLYTGKIYKHLRDKAFTVWQFVKKHYRNMKKITWDEAFDLEDKPIPFSERNNIKSIVKPIQKIIQTSLFDGELKPI